MRRLLTVRLEMNQPKKLEAIIKELRASDAKMKDDDHVGFGLLCIVIFFLSILYLIEGDILIFIVLNGCLGLGILSYYWITALRKHKSWYWEKVRLEIEGKNLREMWETCERGDWLLWFAAHMIGKNGWPTHQQVVLASCQCARVAIKHVKSGETRPLKAIETAEAWARGEATQEQVRNAGHAADYMEHDNTAYCAAQAAKGACWAVYAREDGACFRFAQAASDAPTHAAWASDFANGKREEKATLRECADVVRRMLSIPNELTNELPIYDWVKRWHRNNNGQRTGRIEYIPIAVSRSSPNFELKGNEIDLKKLNPALRIITFLMVLAAAWTLVGALDKNPIQYYTNLRWVTCLAAAMLVWRGDRQGSLKWAYMLVPVVILFNPIIPIHLHGKKFDILKTWQALDIVTAVVMVLTVTLMEIQILLTKKRNVTKPNTETGCKTKGLFRG